MCVKHVKTWECETVMLWRFSVQSPAHLVLDDGQAVQDVCDELRQKGTQVPSGGAGALCTRASAGWAWQVGKWGGGGGVF